MGETSRRRVLGVAVAGAIGTAGAVAAGGGSAQAVVTSGEPLVAYIADPGSGSLTLMSGDREIVVQDADLIARIFSAARAN